MATSMKKSVPMKHATVMKAPAMKAFAKQEKIVKARTKTTTKKDDQEGGKTTSHIYLVWEEMLDFNYAKEETFDASRIVVGAFSSPEQANQAIVDICKDEMYTKASSLTVQKAHDEKLIEKDPETGCYLVNLFHIYDDLKTKDNINPIKEDCESTGSDEEEQCRDDDVSTTNPSWFSSWFPSWSSKKQVEVDDFPALSIQGIRYWAQKLPIDDFSQFE